MIAVMLLLAGLTLAAEPALFYSKSFPGSKPEYVSVEINQDGRAIYKESPQDENPVDFKLSPQDCAALFDLAASLDHFKRPLESGLKVANMGEKTFRFVNGVEKHEVKFNFSLDENAKVLSDWFERITETQQLLFDLERTVRFDKLGVNNSILRIQAAWDRKRIVGPERFLPLLDRVVKNDTYLNMARERAALMAATFRDPKPATAENKQPRPQASGPKSQ